MSSPDTIVQLNQELDATKAVMLENIDKVIQRGENVDQLEQKTFELNQDAKLFNNNTIKLRRAFCARYWQMIIIALSAIILIIGIIIIIVVCFNSCNFQ